MRGVTHEQVHAYFAQLSRLWVEPVTVRLIGGCALFLLGNHRTTLDVDYIGDDIHHTDFQKVAQALAREMLLELEPVPLEGMIPIPPGADARSRPVGQYGTVTVVVFDPYSIALSKLDRGSHTDLEDVAFLLSRSYVDARVLADMVRDVLPNAREYDLSPNDMGTRLASLLASPRQ